MAVISLKQFTGAVPRSPAHMLPDTGAALAFDCNLTHGELRPLMAPLQVAGPMTNIVRGLYTEDGANFYTWDHDVFGVRTPLIDDTYGRFYYSEEPNGVVPAQFRVYTLTAPAGFGPGANPRGGPPPQLLYVGVPKPPAGMGLTAVTALDSITLPDLGPDGLNLQLNFWYEKDGQRYQEQDQISWLGIGLDGSFGPSIRKWRIDLPDLITTINAQQTPARVHANEIIYSTTSSSGQVYDTTGSVFANIQIVSADTLNVLSASGGVSTTYTGVKQYSDANGVWHDLSEAIATVQAQLATPPDALPVVEAILKDMTSGQDIYHLYSSNSSLANSSTGKVSGAVLSVSKDAATDRTLIVQIDYPIYDTRAYVVTVVNAWGEESVPGDPITVSLRYDQMALLDFVFQNNGLYKEQVTARVYRTLTSNSGSTDYQFVSEQSLLPDGIHVATFSHAFQWGDQLPASKLGEVLPATTWDAPPTDLRCVTAMPNGVLAAFRKNELYFCEPFHPYAWPVDYIISFPYDIVAICSHGNGLLVTTTAYPYMVSGVHPESMTAQKLPIMQAGVSTRGIADMGDSVAYLSHDGIVLISGGQGSLSASQALFTREDWRDKFDSNGRSLTSLHLAVHDGMLVAVDQAHPGFVIRLDESGGQYTDCSVVANAAFLLPQTDTFYLGIGNGVYSFNASTTPLYATWVSKDFVVPRPTNFGALQIIAQGMGDAPSLEYAVYADGREVQRLFLSIGTTQQNYIVRLPSGFRARRWAVAVRGLAIVKEIHLANLPAELQNA